MHKRKQNNFLFIETFIDDSDGSLYVVDSNKKSSKVFGENT